MSVVFATPAPPTALPTIYRAGDLVLSNPQETCIIFVSVILISASLEFALQRISTVENKYAKLLVTTMSQEVTIIGVLALFLMFSISVVPKQLITQLYVTLFSWANLTLFFMALFFVLTVVVQFLWVAIDTRVWKAYEDGRIDSDEGGRFREPLYKYCFEQYRIVLEQRARLSTSALPFYEYVATNARRQLVRFSNLSFRTWLSLSFVVLANLLRTKLTPFVSTSNDDKFKNLMLYVFVIGWGLMTVYLCYFTVLQYRLRKYCQGRIQTTDPTELLPFGTSKRGIEFLQIILMSFNWYVTLFVTGNAKEISGLQSSLASTVYVLFAIPVLVFHSTLSWTMYTIAMLVTVGRLKPAEAIKLKKRFKGEIDAGSSSDDDDGAPPPPPKKRPLFERGSLGGVADADVASVSSTSTLNQRPLWLEDDDEWDGTRTFAQGERYAAESNVAIGRTFFNSVKPNTVRYMLSRSEDPEVSRAYQRVEDEQQIEMEERQAVPGRPIWWEPGDAL